MNEAPLSFEATAFQCFVRGLRGVWRDEAYRGTRRGGAARRQRRARGNRAPGARKLGLPAVFLAGAPLAAVQVLRPLRRGALDGSSARTSSRRVLDEAARRHPERLAARSGAGAARIREARWTRTSTAAASGATPATPSPTRLPPAPIRSRFSIRARPWTLYAAYGARARAAGEGDPRPRLHLGRLDARAEARVPGREVTGIDVGAPTLMLAHLRSLEEGLEIHWRQANAEQLP